MSMSPHPIEQIGLAVSDDGLNFERVGTDGLILSRDEGVAWRNVHVCNPTILKSDSQTEWLMFYQGVGRNSERNLTSVALARSHSLENWSQPDLPFLTIDHLLPMFGAPQGVGGVGVIEPAVIFSAGTWHIWFIVVHPAALGNALVHAQSRDLVEWRIDDKPLLMGRELGRYRIHYPQIADGHDGRTLWLTLVDERFGGHGIVAANMALGADTALGHFHQVLPTFRKAVPTSIRPSPIALPMVPLDGNESRARNFLKRGWNATARRLTYYSSAAGSTEHGICRGKWGFAHPHFIQIEDSHCLYFHWCNASKFGLQLDIGKTVMRGPRHSSLDTVLRAGRSGAWDDFFVADPFVVVE